MNRRATVNLGPHDRHFVFDSEEGEIAVYNAAHAETYHCAALNRCVGGEGFGHQGRCPRGTFRLGTPEPRNTIPFGAWFIPVEDLTPDGPMHRWHRAGIGIHGGGSGLKAPFAPMQPLVETEGCLRVHNRDLAELAKIVVQAGMDGGVCYLTVEGA
jgi:hypothetical protein